MQYRPEVDGLRAVAVVPVVFFHAGFSGFSGGFVGVDVFFVISGYLITSIILQETAQGTFTLLSFYERRARRILPALLCVLAACLVPAYMWLFPMEVRGFSSSLAATLLFSSNIYFFLRTSYFQQDSETVPLLHTWSLSVEEQFYLFYPLLLIVLLAKCKRLLPLAIGALFLVSLLAADLGGNFSLFPPGVRWPLSPSNPPSWAFYLLPARIWELLIGAAVALYKERSEALPALSSHLAAQIGGAAGLVAIAVAITVYDRSTPFPSLHALLPTLGAALVLLFAREGTLAQRALSNRVFVGLGLISYSFYLWHQPLFAFARVRSLSGVSVSGYLALIGLALVLAFLSWRLVERPLRDRNRVSAARFVGAVGGAAALLMGFSTAGFLSSGFPQRLSREVAEMAGQRDFTALLQQTCNAVDVKKICIHGEGVASVALVGDSHGGVIVRELAAAFAGRKTAVADYHLNGCPPVRGFASRPGFECWRTDVVLDEVERLDHITTVVLLARWPLWFEGRAFDNKEGGRDADFTGRAEFLVPGGDRAEAMGKAIDEVVGRFLARGKTVALIYPVPEVGWDVRPHLARLQLFGTLKGELSTSFEVYKERNAKALAALSAIPAHARLIRIDPASLFCNTLLPGRCLASKGRQPLYFDRDHLDAEGARMLAEAIVGRVGEAK